MATIEVGGHGYQNFLNADMEGGKLFDQHPEWFGADAQGTRHKEKNRVFCSSNPQAVDYLIKNFKRLWKDLAGDSNLRLLAAGWGEVVRM